MEATSILTESKNSISKNWLLGLTLGGYAILSLALFMFGGGQWIFPYNDLDPTGPPSGQFQAFWLLIPGVFVVSLGFLQVEAESLLGCKANERLTSLSVWLNAVPILGFFALIWLSSMHWVFASFVALATLFASTLAFCLGILMGAANLIWLGIAAIKKKRLQLPSSASSRPFN